MLAIMCRAAVHRTCEALKGGTSVYLADRVVPMLPVRLSNGICSLNQGQDRLTLSCLMDIDSSGKRISYQIAETVIRVDERMCYTDVKNILEDTDPQAKRKICIVDSHVFPYERTFGDHP